jgi:hypothetical protein
MGFAGARSALRISDADPLAVVVKPGLAMIALVADVASFADAYGFLVVCPAAAVAAVQVLARLLLAGANQAQNKSAGYNR